ncbi:hypothetical protein [uncultured Dysosmobacter sp.]|uniref:hypothetical protein n=1 Tax=uncultured Dysosmobacter sp. TaxID=2591384 RepID=UPI0026267A92|nr:hypothetical protein [uncultured Dysosmobacter sp.]
MKEKIVNRLVSVKSIVTIVLTLVFAAMSIKGHLDQNFMLVYTVIISFYFGTQSQKGTDPTPTPSDTSPVDAEELGEAVTKEVISRLGLNNKAVLTVAETNTNERA